MGLMRLARRAVRADPRNAGYLETLGAALYRAGDYPEARECLDRAVAQQDERARAHATDTARQPHHVAAGAKAFRDRATQIDAGAAAANPPSGPPFAGIPAHGAQLPA